MIEYCEQMTFNLDEKWLKINTLETHLVTGEGVDGVGSTGFGVTIPYSEGKSSF